MMEQYFPDAGERYFDDHLPTKVHQLVSESFPELNLIGQSPMVSHAQQEFVTPDTH